MSFLDVPQLFSVAPDVTGLRTGMVNLYLIGVPGSAFWVLIDTGLSGYRKKIERAAERLFGAAPPSAIFFTHGHFDHIGNLSELQRRWDCPCFAPAAEAAHINGLTKYPRPDPTVGGLIALLSVLFPRRLRSPLREVLPFEAQVGRTHLPEWLFMSTPGHSEGHISLFRPSDRLLIAGDALIGTRQESFWSVLCQRMELRPPPPYFTTDWSMAYDSICRLRELKPETLASGHGPVIRGSALRDALDNLVINFSDIGLPTRGRYVKETWYDRLAYTPNNVDAH